MRDVGLTAVTVGAALTVKIEPLVKVPVSGFVSVTVLVPSEAFAATVTFTVSDVALLNVVELTVTPLFAKVTTAPLTKFVPVSVKFWLVALWPLDAGLIPVIVGTEMKLTAAVWPITTESVVSVAV